jgi:hypothetical protein
MKFDARNSFISSRNVNMSGIRAGFSFDNRLQLGFGYSYLSSNLERTYFLAENNQNYLARFKFNYFSLFGEYIFYKKNRWEHSIPVLFGFGKGWYRLETLGFNLYKDSFFIYEPSMQTLFKVFDWFGVGGGIGYRLAVGKQVHINEQLTSPLYVVKINFYTEPIFDLIRERFPKEDKN